MSLLLIGLQRPLGVALVERLVAEGDEVRVLEPDHGSDELWKSLGAYVAVGPADDWDLVERAATNVRTLVVGSDAPQDLDEILTGADKASVGRIVVCGDAPDREIVAALRDSSLEYVVLSTGKKTLLGRSRPVDDARVAEAIDAADDLAGEPRLELDLTDESAWSALLLEPG